MALVRKFTSSCEEARSAVIYMRNKGVQGPGFGRSNERLVTALQEVQQELVRQMPDACFFISMIPEHYLHAKTKHRTEVHEVQPVPDFARGFAPIFKLLEADTNVMHSCDVRIDVDTGRRYCGVGPKL